ncbi:MAG TPA: enoyl-CoA hydratase/isomerase family protein [Lacipirellulaceae bacterium]|nr:enoyl-CoA hydratase/isomerase family protein [Lacipirellulaceae bacterium]
MSRLVLVETVERGIVMVTLNRPERRNALSIDLLDQLYVAIEQLASDPAHRVVVLRGAGPVFSSGLDLREAADSALVERSAAAVSRALDLLRTTPLVMIAAVQGGAFAGGAGLMAACDIVIAAADAKFSFPEVRRGLLPALISNVLLHRVREGDLRELLLAGEAVDANRAREVGLVQRVVPAEQLMDEALRVANSIVSGGPQTIRQTKSLLNAMYSSTTSPAGPDLVAMHLTARNSAEAREGLAAFAEKRKPNWEL